jgi:hypothetical protein
MKINQLAAKPQLVKLELDSPETIEAFGEAIEFWTWDRQPLETFMKLAGGSQNDYAKMLDVVRTLILDEEGKQVIQGENTLPSKVLIAAVAKIVELLGK